MVNEQGINEKVAEAIKKNLKDAEVIVRSEGSHFDIEVFAKYRSKRLSLDKVPAKDLNLALADLTKELSDKVVPRISERSRRGTKISRTNR